MAVGRLAPVDRWTVAYAAFASLAILDDATVQAGEQAIFSGRPSQEWIRQEPWPALSAVLHAGYLSYYFVVPTAPLRLWVSGRRDGARRTIALSVAAFYLSYVVFLVFPVR